MYKRNSKTTIKQHQTPTNIQERWKEAHKILSLKLNKRHHTNNKITFLSDERQKFRQDQSLDDNQKEVLCQERNEILINIHSFVILEETKRVERQIEETV